MDLPFHLGLRGDRHLLGVVRHPGTQREQLAMPYAPHEEDRRQRILSQWAIPALSPRVMAHNGTNQPLPPRAQAIRSWEVENSVRQRIASGVPAPVMSRKDNQAGLQSRLHLGPDRASLPVHSRNGPRNSFAPLQATPATRAGHQR